MKMRVSKIGRPSVVPSVVPSVDPSVEVLGGGQPDFSDFSDPDFGKINFHIGEIGKQFFANISLPDHLRAYVAS